MVAYSFRGLWFDQINRIGSIKIGGRKREIDSIHDDEIVVEGDYRV